MVVRVTRDGDKSEVDEIIPSGRVKLMSDLAFVGRGIQEDRNGEHVPRCGRPVGA